MVEAMEIQSGFKQTEVGVIPRDWHLSQMDKICDVRDGTHESPKYHANGVIFITSKNIVNGKIDFSEISYISAEDAVNIDKRSKVDNGDILMSMIGTIGNCVLVDFEPNFCIKNVALIKPQKIEGRFLVQLLFSQFYQYYIKSKLDGGIQKFISLGVLRSLDVRLPPTKAEQTAIATALNDADALVTQLEKLIAKKRAIKQGAMQELLKPKEGWEVKKLGEMDFDISDGNYSSKYPKSSEFIDIGVPFIRANNIKGMSVIDDDMRFISPQLHNELSKGHLKRDDILITTRGEIGNVAIVPEKHINSNINAQIVRINTNQKLQKHYFAYFLIKKEIQEFLLNHQTGSALKQLPVGVLKELPITFPKIEKQNYTGLFLSDMDTEIEGLENKLNKYKMIKHGMMQNLLTGRIRLV